MNIVPVVDVSVDIDDGALGVTTGTSSVYTVLVANAGPSAVVDLRMTSDVVGLTNLDWQCLQAQSSAPCPVPDVGAGVWSQAASRVVSATPVSKTRILIVRTPNIRPIAGLARSN